MKRLTCKIVVAAVMLLVATPLSSSAQVGVNTVTPDTTALLDIHFSGTGQVGVLFPDVGDDMRQSKKEVSDGMVVFDRKRKMFYYYDDDLKEWVAMSPFGVVHDDSKLNDIRPQDSEVNSLNMSLGLPDSEKATAKLDVNGSVRVRSHARIDGNVKVNGSDTIQQNLIVKGTTTLQNPTTINSTLTVTSNINAGSNAVTAGTVNATYGTATVPVGGIIMWSDILNPLASNWKVCDGTKIDDPQSPIHGKVTPNLQGRFIVGAGQYANTHGDTRETNLPSYAIGAAGGVNMYALAAPEMPNHDHTMHAQGSITAGDNIFLSRSPEVNSYSGGGAAPFGGSRTIDSNMRTSAEGGGTSHENRPPYYALAYIMRIR
jgi:microcystin-dependent protein